MSYVSPGRDPRRPRRDRRPGGARRSLVVVLAVVVPAAVVAGIVWLVMSSSGDDGGRVAADRAPGSGGAPPSASASKSSPPSKSEQHLPPTTRKPTGSKPPAGPLAGKVVVIDPGHNPGNSRHTAEINKQVGIGTNRKECDTTGTATNDGYPEAQFTLDVSRRLRKLLQDEGATVKLTQDGDRPWGPCVDERAEIGNKAKADAVVSVHADGAPVGDRGFHVILPAPVHAGDADTRKIAAPSRDLGTRIAGRFVAVTGSAASNYIGGGTGLDERSDLGGLNLSKVPKVFIECGNMRDPHDAALVKSGDWRQKAARGISEGIMSFLEQ
ncbi:N-acetylmuramoyl-L-alanine amidase [Streptomyces sp. NPDC050560]|uniref:N-acetylmuramoyl-L-alanine amidase n=1 Tax=Streptomyces sp. NPDC050560 TaxID=3365630 RepID=UPI0037ADBE73